MTSEEQDKKKNTDFRWHSLKELHNCEDQVVDGKVTSKTGVKNKMVGPGL